MTAEDLIRAATPDDVPQLERVMIDTSPGGAIAAGVLGGYLGHLVGRGSVAVAVDADGVVLGFAAAVDTGRARHLADLFVLPDMQSRGLGGRLLRAAMGDATPRTTFASDDPRAVPLYIRAGMRPLHPNFDLAGDPRRVPLPAGHAVEGTTFQHMAALERAWAGVERGPDLGYWAALGEPRPFVVTFAGREVATGFARRKLVGRDRRLDHAIVAPDADPLAALLAAIASEAGLADESGAYLLGPSPLLPVLLEAGFRIVDRDTYLASDPALVDPTREIVNTGIL